VFCQYYALTLTIYFDANYHQGFTNLRNSRIFFYVMPIIKSAMKRARQALVRRSRNLQVKRAIHNDTRAVMDAASAGDSSLTQDKLREAQSQIDRAVKKGTLHKNTAARRKSRLVAASVRTLATASTEEAKPKAKAKVAPTKKAPAKKSATKSTT
jgi:small subunit ribosomal protein S20